MAYGKKAHELGDIGKLAKEKDDTSQIQQVIIPRDHVFGPKIDIRKWLDAFVGHHKRLIPGHDPMGH
jgi:hypothetical protein